MPPRKFARTLEPVPESGLHASEEQLAAFSQRRHVLTDEAVQALMKDARQYRYTPTGLDIQAELSQDAWLNMLAEIRAIKTAYQWVVGDWLLYGLNHEYGSIRTEYEKYARLTGYSPDTMENIAVVCRAFDFPRRRGNLSFKHHAEVAPLSPEEQEDWLDKAESGGWSAKRLRRAIIASQKEGAPALPAKPPLWQKRFDVAESKLYEHWQNMTMKEQSRVIEHLEQMLATLKANKRIRKK